MPPYRLFLARGLPLAATLALTAALPVRAEIELSMEAAREVTVTGEDGARRVQREPGSAIRRGDVMVLSVRYRNTDPATADRVIIENPVPDGTFYLPGGAGGDGATVEFSVDGGLSYRSGDGIDPDRVTHLRWIVEHVPGGGEGEVFVRLRVAGPGAPRR